MKVLVLALLFAVTVVGVPAEAPGAAKQGTTAPERALVIELTVPAPVSQVWEAFATAKGLETWLAPSATVDLRPGGDWLVHMGPSTGGGAVVSFVPEKELVIAAMAPDKFPTVRATRTRAVFTFVSQGGATVVRLTQTGWQQGPEWDAAYEYLMAGNAQLMAMLHKRFVSGPTDWAKAE